MKLLRVGPAGAERPALLDQDGVVRDLSGLVTDIDGATLADAGAMARIAAAAADGSLPAADASLRVGPPLTRIGKIVCIGLNYHDHAAETGAQVPGEPVVFMKAPDTVVGPTDTVLVPRGSTKTDWEVELAVVIGRELRYAADADEAMAAVAGYAVAHDVSEREFQIERGGQWDKGKNCETFNPLGPWLVTADEIPDPQALSLRLWVNGVLRQDGSTRDQIFPVAEVVRYLSHFMTLYPGDVINTGTPAGVALGQPEPRPYLRPGDVVELSIDGLGRQRQELAAA
ncbi:fumarylacetoacetate hydrolase family protein [Actinacidiphila bryophytorum]|uniref:Ureidoglycolate lyase n=1 Tax=Actinacidiphila bryophytorum TaxID=1436133 RepID=A0A9W4E9A8_9ACTN|nr:fumarylacetoacetate hydrolase family protein [Actinacidiphila bryophytorum]MBM9434317.1 fumarylacetoacetate hydrolase family protein [Actinacidiphila bryophytorum]MBN6545932.1 fumarylacetoacetate hydrolase family protein [Actinacidiphila bryophytorum]CAG7624691.1 Ureidoglycolate lyase [Actinacidiphila bryophytorum]